MKRLGLPFALALSLLPLAAARAQVAVRIQVALPAAPPLVVVKPGVQVVENQDEEVFFSNGWYWVQRDGYWYRARNPRSAFVSVERRRVPVAIVRLPPGHYRHWRHAEVREERRERRAERKEFRERERHRERGHDRHGRRDG
jgi:hypothetical protein